MLWDFRRGFLEFSIDSRQIFGERNDGIDMEDIELIVRFDLGSQVNLWRWTRGLWFRRWAISLLLAFFGS